MKPGLRVSAAATLAILFGFSAAYLRRPPDPVFEGRPVSQWTADLLSPDYSVRAEAQAALRILGEPAVPQLCVLLRKRNLPWEKHLVRLSSILPFWDHKTVDAAACRERAAEMLGLLGPKAAAAIPDLIAILGLDQSSSEAERALIRIGPASMPHLGRVLLPSNRTDPAVRIHAARLLREFRDVDAAALSALIAATADSNPRVREEASLALGATARNQPAAVRALLPLSADREDSVRAAAVKAVGQVGRSDEEALAVLRTRLRDQSALVRLEAAKSLWKLDHNSGLSVPVLIQLLKGHERRWEAAYALGEIGPLADAAVPALVSALEQEKVPRPFRTPPSTAFALGKVGTAAIPRLSPLLQDRDARVRLNALLAFGFMGGSAVEAVPQVGALLQDDDSEVRHTAALTLAAIGGSRDQVLDGLADCLHAEDVYMRSAAAAALRKIAPEGNWIVQPE